MSVVQEISAVMWLCWITIFHESGTVQELFRAPKTDATKAIPDHYR